LAAQKIQMTMTDFIKRHDRQAFVVALPREYDCIIMLAL
jgi:hypothetical protein